MPPARIRYRWLIGASALLALASVVWFMQGSRDRGPDFEGPVTSEAQTSIGDLRTATGGALSTAVEGVSPTVEPPPITISPAATELGAALLRKDDPAGALQAVEQLLYFYRQGLGENPVGQNEDVVAAMLGENSKRAAFLPPDSPAIQGGRLVDPWGTPYWFHPVSRDRMEIRSAGPDRELFTSDDLQGN